MKRFKKKSRLKIVLFLITWFLLPLQNVYAIPEDLNGDGLVNKVDVTQWTECFEGNGTCDGADINGDGNNNFLDLQMIIAKFSSPFPGIVFLAPIDTDKLSVAWLPSIDDHTPAENMRYEVHISQQPDFEPTANTLYTITGELQTEIHGLTAGTTYYVLVIVIDENGKSTPDRVYRSAKTFTKPVILSNLTPLVIAEDNGLGIPTKNGSEYTYPKTPETIIPEIGSVIIGEDGESGYMKKVESVNTTSDSIIVRTGETSLSDVMEQGTIMSTITLFDVREATEIQVASRSGIQAIDVDGNRYSQISWEKELLVAEQVDYTVKEDNLLVKPEQQSGHYSIELLSSRETRSDFGVEASSELTLKYGITFEPEFITDVAWTFDGISPNIEKGMIVAKGTLSMDADANFTFKGAANYNRDFPIYKKTFRAVYTAGTVPVYQEITLNINGEITATASSKIEANAHANATATVELGVNFNPVTGSWEPIASKTLSKEFKAKLSVQGGVSAEVRLIPEVQVRFYRVLSGSVFIEPYLSGEITAEMIMHPELLADIAPFIAQPTKFDFSLGLEGYASAAFHIFTKKFPILNKTKILGPLEYALFNLPSIKKVSAEPDDISLDESSQVTLETEDGKNNPFDDTSVKWFVYPKTGQVQRGKVGTFTASEEGQYTVFGSGYGRLGKAGRQFKDTTIIVRPTPTPTPTPTPGSTPTPSSTPTVPGDPTSLSLSCGFGNPPFDDRPAIVSTLDLPTPNSFAVILRPTNITGDPFPGPNSLVLIIFFGGETESRGTFALPSNCVLGPPCSPCPTPGTCSVTYTITEINSSSPWPQQFLGQSVTCTF